MKLNAIFFGYLGIDITVMKPTEVLMERKDHQISASKQKAKHVTFPVTGMSCASCAVSVESTLKSVEGVSNAGVNFASQTAWADIDASKVKPSSLQDAVRAIGYDIIIDTKDPLAAQEKVQQHQYAQLKHNTIWSAILAVPLVIFGMFFMDNWMLTWISLPITIMVVFWFGRSFFVNAWKQAAHGRVNMDTLVAISTGVAFSFSVFNTAFPEFWHSRGLHAHVYYESAAVIICFISLGHLLEERAKAKTSSAIKKLMSLQPTTVHVINGGTEADISINQVQVGNILVVKPGEKIPVDGKVIDGLSHVDESTITGESMPAEKKKGDLVYAGTINQKGSFRFEAQKIGTETMLAKIISAVQQAQGSKAPVQKLVDKIAGIFVPIVIGIALVTFICWLVAGDENAITHALLTSISVLVIACPCALGLATPTAIMVGIGKGAENNILIKDAESLELGSRVNAVVLDKTGTITEGKPEVVNEIWSANLKDLQYCKNILLTLEKQSEHPISQAIVKKMTQENAQSFELRDFVSITGRGVSAIVNGQSFVAGNKRLMDEKNIVMPVDITGEVGRWQQNAGTVIYFANDREVAGAFVVADKIKQTSREAIKTLHDRGIEVFMLTGDNEQTASSVARQVGIKQYRSEFLPADKATFIEELQHKGKIVAMAGDGINDSQALALADVSIAMGKGSDIAMDVAAITLITADLRAIPKAFSLSRKTVRGIRQNLFWAFIYNLVGIPLAAGILYPINGFLLDPMIAGAAMALSSVSVVLNSLRLRTITIN